LRVTWDKPILRGTQQRKKVAERLIKKSFSASKLSPEQSAELDSLMGDIDWNLPLNTPESKLQEMRALLREFVGE